MVNLERQFLSNGATVSRAECHSEEIASSEAGRAQGRRWIRAIATTTTVLVLPACMRIEFGLKQAGGAPVQGFHARPTALPMLGPSRSPLANATERLLWKETARHRPLLLSGTVEPRARLTVAGHGALKILADRPRTGARQMPGSLGPKWSVFWNLAPPQQQHVTHQVHPSNSPSCT